MSDVKKIWEVCAEYGTNSYRTTVGAKTLDEAVGLWAAVHDSQCHASDRVLDNKTIDVEVFELSEPPKQYKCSVSGKTTVVYKTFLVERIDWEGTTEYFKGPNTSETGICDRHGNRYDPDAMVKWLNAIAGSDPQNPLHSAADIMRGLWNIVLECRRH